MYLLSNRGEVGGLSVPKADFPHTMGPAAAAAAAKLTMLDALWACPSNAGHCASYHLLSPLQLPFILQCDRKK